MNYARASFAVAEPSWPPLSGTIGLYSDLDATTDGVMERKRRRLLLEAIRHMPSMAEARGYARVSQNTLGIAMEFVQRLPTNRALPKVAVDEDGDLLMMWNEPTGRCALTFEGSKLHMVLNPGAKSTHKDPTIYNGGHIPPGILSGIPVRR